MRLWATRVASSLLVAAAASAATFASARELSLDDRVRAQEAIERFYYSHQIGATKPFEQAVPRAVLEHKVRKYLAQSEALDRNWKEPITAETLRREAERIVRNSRFPDRLAGLFAALENDPFVIEECLARASLADRLVRNFSQADSFDYWWTTVEPTLDVTRVVPVSTSTDLPKLESRSTLACTATGAWDNGSLDVPPDPLRASSSVFTGSVMLVWGTEVNGNTPPRYAALRSYDPLTDTWMRLSSVNQPAPRLRHTAIWTGTEMIVWGGTDQAASLNSGARYDPVSDVWTTMSTVNAPAGRESHTAVWTGTRMIVWGGRAASPSVVASGGIYDPATDSWTPTSMTGAPTARFLHSAVWSGTEMIVWGGNRFISIPNSLASGGRYNPDTNTWQPTSLINVPQKRESHTSVWTGSEMIVWGGRDHDTSQDLNTGGRYSPTTDTWTATSTAGAPTARTTHSMIWTGSRVIVWGGIYIGNGGIYNPVTDTWASTSFVGAPSARLGHNCVWTGSRMIVWGGMYYQGSYQVASGARYDPATDSWTPTSMGPAPRARSSPTAVWTGNTMIVYGGNVGETSTFPSEGLRYDPLLDSWTSTSTVNAPEGRASHTAVWTGSVMVVWGGHNPSPTPLQTGGRYDPSTDTWTPTSMSGAPAIRTQHTAVWTGSKMIVWGGAGSGTEGFPVGVNTGGLYDPATDAWTPTSTAGAAALRYRHTAIWTGTRMIVWGGEWRPSQTVTTRLNSGGIYDPATDGWTATSTVNAPSARTSPNSVWTGDQAIVWSGFDSAGNLATGAKLDPIANTWTTMSTSGAPITSGPVVWTGNRMLTWGYYANGEYDPSIDSWTPLNSAGEPFPRLSHVMVWTGTEAIVWGGNIIGAPFNTGGRYVFTPRTAEVTGLMFQADDTIGWDFAAPSPAPLYDVLRGTIGQPVGVDPNETCLAQGLADSSIADSDVPAAGTGFRYLVRAQQGACTTGSYGSASNGVERVSSTCP